MFGGKGSFRGPYQDAVLKLAPILALLVLGFGLAVLVMDHFQSKSASVPTPTVTFPANKNTLVRMLASKR